VTTAEDRLRAAQAALDQAARHISDHVGQAKVARPGEAMTRVELTPEWGDELDRMEKDLDAAVAELLLAARDVLVLPRP
jgi:hypothetical protein